MKAIRNLFLYSIIITIIIFAILIFFVKLPDAKMLSASEVYDINGKLVDKIFIENRTKVSISKIPQDLQNAVIAVEDNRFYKHFGIDPLGILRALYINLKAGRIVEGGSTITQQLAKNLYLSHKRTLTRKLKELLLTLKLEFLYTKKQILEMYLNEIYFGSGVYGVQSASQLYFGKNVSDLNLAECALLAGIPRRPEYYSPLKNFKASKERQALILNKMAEYGYITKEKAEAAKKTKITIKQKQTKTEAAYFIQYVLDKISDHNKELLQKVYNGGYKIYTSLNLELQQAAERAFDKNIGKGTTNSKGIKQPQGALVAIDSNTGYINALIGGRDYLKSQFNRATAKRQPGSAFKPFVYTAALDSGYTTIDEMVCEPTKYPRGDGSYWTPKDYKGDYHYRPISLREALVISDNVVTVKWLKKLGVKKVINYAKKMGINSKLQPNLTLALGSSEVTPLEMAVAYCVFSNGGYKVKPVALLKLVDPEGKVIIKNSPSKKKVLSKQVTYVLTDILKGVLKPGGTAEFLRVDGPAAGKTGTTQKNRDAWFVGYTPYLSTAVYVGFDNPERSLWSVGGVIAGPIWRDFINYSINVFGKKDFEKPEGIITKKVCKDTLKLPNITCPVKTEIFIEGTQPKEKCTKTHWEPWLNDSENDDQKENDDEIKKDKTNQPDETDQKNKQESQETEQQDQNIKDDFLDEINKLLN